MNDIGKIRTILCFVTRKSRSHISTIWLLKKVIVTYFNKFPFRNHFQQHFVLIIKVTFLPFVDLALIRACAILSRVLIFMSFHEYFFFEFIVKKCQHHIYLIHFQIIGSNNCQQQSHRGHFGYLGESLFIINTFKLRVSLCY